MFTLFFFFFTTTICQSPPSEWLLDCLFFYLFIYFTKNAQAGKMCSALTGECINQSLTLQFIRSLGMHPKRPQTKQAAVLSDTSHGCLGPACKTLKACGAQGELCSSEGAVTSGGGKEGWTCIVCARARWPSRAADTDRSRDSFKCLFIDTFKKQRAFRVTWFP